MRQRKNEILKEIDRINEVEILRIKNEEVEGITSTLFLNNLVEFKNLVLFFNRALKAHKRFYENIRLSKEPVVPMV